MNAIPKTHRLTQLETKLLHALQRLTREREGWGGHLAVPATPEEIAQIQEVLRQHKGPRFAIMGGKN